MELDRIHKVMAGLTSEPCLRWGRIGEPDQCILPAQHLGPCETQFGQTLPLYHRMPGEKEIKK